MVSGLVVGELLIVCFLLPLLFPEGAPVCVCMCEWERLSVVSGHGFVTVSYIVLVKELVYRRTEHITCVCVFDYCFSSIVFTSAMLNSCRFAALVVPAAASIVFVHVCVQMYMVPFLEYLFLIQREMPHRV